MSLLSGTLLKPRRSKSLTILFRVLVVGLVIAVIWWVSFRISNAVVIHRLETKIKQYNDPLTLADLAAMHPPIPEPENGAARLVELWEAEYPGYGTTFLPNSKMPPTYRNETNDPALPFIGANAERIPRTGALSSTNREAAEAFLKKRNDHLDAVRIALQRPQSWFPVQLTNGFDTTLPHLAELKYEAQSFRIRALMAAEQNDVDGALTSLEDVARVGHMLKSEPFLISQLVHLAIYSMVIDDLQRLFSCRTLSTEHLARVEKLVDQLQTAGALRTAIVSERVCALSLFEHPAETLAALDAKKRSDPERHSARYVWEARLLNLIGFTDADHYLVLKTWDSALTFADDGSPAAMRKYERVFWQAGETAQQFPRKVISGVVLPVFQSSARRFMILEGRRRAVQLAIVIERYRAAHGGALPEGVSDLVPQFFYSTYTVPQDPFTASFIHYKRLPVGYVTYSVGHDRTDEDGKEKPQKSTQEDYDETFIVERP